MHEELDPLVVSLDLDETLIYCSTTPFHYRGETFTMALDGEVYYGSVRPGARELIDHLFSNPDRFQVGVYSSSTRDYVEGVIKALLSEGQRDCLSFVYGREKTRQAVLFDPNTGWDFREARPQAVKDIDKVRRRIKRKSRDRIVVLDDKPKVWPRSYGNILPVPEFNADTLDDTVMKGAISALNLLSGLDDIRPIEKRGMVIRHANKLKHSDDLTPN